MSNDREVSAHLLVVDDDEGIAQLLQRYFSSHGFRVSCAADGSAMRAALSRGDTDLVLLDLGLPGEDGLALLGHLREHWGGPVIVVTGRSDAVDRVVGLEIGADDYITKPFDLRETLARVRSVLRRSHAAGNGVRADAAVEEFAGYRLDRASRLLTDAEGRPVALTAGEFALLCAFLDRPHCVLSRDNLLNATHGREAAPFDRTIDMQVGRLRRKIEADPAAPSLIKSVRGAGYLFTAAVRRP